MAQPRVLAVLPHVIPSTVLYILKPLAALDRARQIDAEFELEYTVSPRQVERADVVIFCRNTDPACAAALRTAVAAGKPVVYDLDDNFFAMPAYSRAERNYARPERLAQLEWYLRSAGLVRVYSERLRRRVAAINPNVKCVAGPVDWTLVPDEVQRSPERVSIVYATGRLGDELARIFLDDMERVLSAFPDRVKLFLWGFRSKRFARHPAVQTLSPIADYDRFFARFARSGFDIGLAPLPADEFHLSKSSIKFREYAACRIAGIYSDVEVYDCVQHGVTGLKVPDRPGAWFEAVASLIQDQSLRSAIQAQAYAHARATYGQDQFCNLWMEQIRCLLAAPRPAAVVTSPPAPPADTPGALRVFKIATHALRLIFRFAGSIRSNGLGDALARARWTLNDLSILSWRQRRHG